MSFDKKTLEQYLEDHVPDYGDADIHSVIDGIYWHYAENNPINNDAIKQCFLCLREILQNLSFEDYDCIITTVCKLCTEHEQVSFVAGFQTGARLMMELFED